MGPPSATGMSCARLAQAGDSYGEAKAVRYANRLGGTAAVGAVRGGVGLHGSSRRASARELTDVARSHRRRSRARQRVHQRARIADEGGGRRLSKRKLTPRRTDMRPPMTTEGAATITPWTGERPPVAHPLPSSPRRPKGSKCEGRRVRPRTTMGPNPKVWPPSEDDAERSSRRTSQVFFFSVE